MAWIRQIEIAAASGLLKRQFDAAVKRAGRLWNILHVMSLNPPVLAASMRFYGAVMSGSSPLSRVRREMLATVVAREVDCFY